MRILLSVISAALVVLAVVLLPCGGTASVWPLPGGALMQKAFIAVRSATQSLLMRMEDDRFKKQMLRLQYKVKTGCYSTLTTTLTTTSTSTTTITTQQYCATLFNVIGACRRRKKLHHTTTLLFDDGDLVIQPTETLLHQYIYIYFIKE